MLFCYQNNYDQDDLSLHLALKLVQFQVNKP